METLRLQRSEHWLDDDIPALDGMTPREAARTPAGRAKLDELLSLYEQFAQPGQFNANPEREWVYRRLNIAAESLPDEQMSAFSVGKDVELHGLTAAGLNGQRGRVIGPGRDGRIPIRLESGSSKLVKPQNLRAFDPMLEAWFRQPARSVMPSGAVSSRLHVEIRAAPPGAPEHDKAVFLVQPESNFLLVVPISSVMNGGRDLITRKDWAPFLVNGVISQLMSDDETGMMYGRPSWITARDPVVVGVLSESLGGRGTEVSLSYDDEIVKSAAIPSGTSLVAIMDGAAADMHSRTADAMGGMGTPLAGGAHARVRRNERGGFESVVPGAPLMAWACTQCHELLPPGSTTPCGLCHVAHFCSSCAHDGTEHKSECCQRWQQRGQSATPLPGPTPGMIASFESMRSGDPPPGEERKMWSGGSQNVTLMGLEDKPEWNGREAIADGTFKDGKYKVKLVSLSGRPRGPELWVDGNNVRIGVDPIQASRARSYARQQLRRALAASEERRNESGAQIISALELMQGLPAEDRSGSLMVVEAAGRLAEMAAESPATAVAAEEALSQVIAMDGWEASPSEDQAAVQSSLDRIHKAVPEEKRRCKCCGENKTQDSFTPNQWRQGKRRCVACQESGATETVEQKEEMAAAEQQKQELAALNEELERERARVQEELARRNACGPSEDECPVCFDEIKEAGQKRTFACHISHWLCCPCLSDLRDDLIRTRRTLDPDEIMKCPHCRAEVPDSSWKRLLSAAAGD